MIRLLTMAASFAVVFATACGAEDTCDPDRTKDAWFGVGGSEFLPWSTRVPRSYDGTESEVCSRGIGAGRLLAVEKAQDGALVVLALLPPDATGASPGVWTAVWADNGPWSVEQFFGMDGARLLANADGDVVVVWWDEAESQKVFHRLVGTDWHSISASNGLAPPAVVGALAIDGRAEPVMVWTAIAGADATLDQEVYGAVLVDGAWTQLGGSATGGGISNTPGVQSHADRVAAAGPDGVSVLWTEHRPSGPSLYLRYYDGQGWEELGGSATDGGVWSNVGFTEPWLLTEPGGRPTVLAVAEGDTVVGRGFQSGAWGDLPPFILDSDGPPSEPVSFTLDREGNPLVVYGGFSAPVRLRRFVGGAWTGVNGSDGKRGISNSATYKEGDTPRVVATDDKICVAWSEFEPTYRYLDGWDYDDMGYPPPKGPYVLLRCTYY